MEHQPQPTEGGEQQRYKRLGVRLDEELHAQLSFIAQLSTGEIRRSIERASRPLRKIQS